MEHQAQLKNFHKAALNIYELEQSLEGIALDDGKEISDYTLEEVLEEAEYILENRVYLEAKERAQLRRFLNRFDPIKETPKRKPRAVQSEFVKTFKQNYEALIIKQVKACIKELKKSKYELSLSRDALHVAVGCLNIHSGVKTTGGRDEINIGAKTIERFTHFKLFKEYSAFNADPVIGEISYANFENLLFLVVAHEVAHHIQYRHLPKVQRFRKTYAKAHGQAFQWVYRQLRCELVNPQINGGKANC